MNIFTADYFRKYKLDMSIFGVMMAIFIVFMIGNPTVFLGIDIYYAFMSTIPLFGLMALSMTFVVTLGLIDLSFASVVAIGAWVFGTVFHATGSVFLALLAALVAGFLSGVVNAFLIVKINIPSLVATIGTMFLFRGLANVLAQGKGISLVDTEGTLWYNLLVGRIGEFVPMQFVWFIVLGVFLAMLYKRHIFGAHVLCIGDNEASAEMMGINVGKIKAIVFIQMSVMAAFCGVLGSLEVTYFWPTMGEGTLLTTLAAVFIGGTSVFGGRGTMWGTMAGCLIIGSLEAGIISIGMSGFVVKLVFGLIITLSVSLYALLMEKAK
jgi:simple sugar transport system permease protein